MSAMDVGAVKAPTIRRSKPCKQLRQSVLISRSRCFRSTTLMRRARWSLTNGWRSRSPYASRRRGFGWYGSSRFHVAGDLCRRHVLHTSPFCFIELSSSTVTSQQPAPAALLTRSGSTLNLGERNMSNPETQSAESTRSPQQVLMQIPEGMWVAQCVATAARLGIADALAQSQPQGSTTLARAVGADASALGRLLRALASLGVLAEPSPQQYALTPVSELLRRDIPGSMRDWLIAETDTPHWQAWGQLYEGVRSGRTVIPELFGMHIYDYYTAHPADLAYFSRAMGNVSALVA